MNTQAVIGYQASYYTFDNQLSSILQEVTDLNMKLHSCTDPDEKSYISMQIEQQLMTLKQLMIAMKLSIDSHDRDTQQYVTLEKQSAISIGNISQEIIKSKQELEYESQRRQIREKIASKYISSIKQRLSVSIATQQLNGILANIKQLNQQKNNIINISKLRIQHFATLLLTGQQTINTLNVISSSSSSSSSEETPAPN